MTTGFFWAPDLEREIRQCHETLLSFTGDVERILASSVKKWCHFSCVCLVRKRGLFGARPVSRRVLFLTKDSFKKCHHALRETGKIWEQSCEWQRLWVTLTRRGAVTNGALTIFGTADSVDFGGYRIEAFGPQTGETWLSIGSNEGQDVVLDGILASTNIGNWLPGSYLIQLQIFNSAGEQTDQCTIEIVLG